MPPRVSPASSRDHRGRGARGSGSPSRGPSIASTQGLPASHIQTVGVRRPGFGTGGIPVTICANAFETTIPDGKIYHYDVAISQTFPIRVNMEMVNRLQRVVAPNIFSPPASYDGRKNMFTSRALQFPGGAQTHEFSVTLRDPQPGATGKGPRIYKVKITKVAEINTEVVNRFINGRQSHDNNVITAIMALNVVMRMDPTTKYPFNVRSFFTEKEKSDIGGGFVLWRGYFQSLRPAIGKMVTNVDISTGCMYKPGPLIDLCLEFLRTPNGPALGTNDFARVIRNDRERIRLQRFLAGVRILTKTNAKLSDIPRTIKGVRNLAAKDETFLMKETGKETGKSITVADYFSQHRNKRLQHPQLPCVVLTTGAFIPLEFCEVLKGQIMRKQVPPHKTKDVLSFATKHPKERLDSIKKGLQVLQYGQSEYMRQFNIHVNEAPGPIKLQARVLRPPRLRYGAGSKDPVAEPRDGAWNMIDKRFYKGATIKNFILIIYESNRRFPANAANDLVKNLMESWGHVGIVKPQNPPIIKWENGQGNIIEQLRRAGMQCKADYGDHPNIIIAIIPDGGVNIYTTVKHFGDVIAGVATQCLSSGKCIRAKQQYFANVSLKINVKLGGINLIPDSAAAAILTDPRQPTLVLGADVIHPAPGPTGRPSFTALVGNVDSDVSKYIATMQVQNTRQEMIGDLFVMARHIIEMYMRYRERVENKDNTAPKRIIFYRDGVSEGQFKQVLDEELPALRNACKALKVQATITVIIVGKRHHFRFFPLGDRDADKSGNCRAGTVIDREIVNPVEFDYYLQSHAGLLGTSRPAHYNVLLDENKFSADGIQALSYLLCHVYARATRSVSIPAPVYYADIVCSRAKNHYDPNSNFELSETATMDSGAADESLERYKKGFKQLNRNHQTVMYFS